MIKIAVFWDMMPCTMVEIRAHVSEEISGFTYSLMGGSGNAGTPS
jgi:hypothetical protein